MRLKGHVSECTLCFKVLHSQVNHHGGTLSVLKYIPRNNVMLCGKAVCVCVWVEIVRFQPFKWDVGDVNLHFFPDSLSLSLLH